MAEQGDFEFLTVTSQEFFSPATPTFSAHDLDDIWQNLQPMSPMSHVAMPLTFALCGGLKKP